MGLSVYILCAQERFIVRVPSKRLTAHRCPIRSQLNKQKRFSTFIYINRRNGRSLTELELTTECDSTFFSLDPLKEKIQLREGRFLGRKHIRYFTSFISTFRLLRLPYRTLQIDRKPTWSRLEKTKACCRRKYPSHWSHQY